MHRGEPIADILDSKVGMKDVLKVAVRKTDNTITEGIVENFQILYSQLQHAIILLNESLSLNC